MIMNVNNEIYRRLYAAYKLKDSDYNQLWKSTRYDYLTYNKTKFFLVADTHEKFSVISAKQLKEFLLALCKAKNVSPEGVSIPLLVGSLVTSEGLTATGDPLKDTESLRSTLRG